MNKLNINQRRKARRAVLQALYQWQMNRGDLFEIEAQYRTETTMDVDYFHELLHEIPNQLENIENTFSVFLDRKVTELNPIELTALRIGTYELINKLEIPYKVAINEAVELNKEFGTVEGYKYVNSILDKVAQKVRQAETEA